MDDELRKSAPPIDGFVVQVDPLGEARRIMDLLAQGRRLEARELMAARARRHEESSRREIAQALDRTGT
jgi:hypothetical protein